MKKGNVINLIKYYSENNDLAFRNEAYEIAKDFDKTGDYQLAEYIMGLLSDVNTFIPQIDENKLVFLKKLEINDEPLPLPDEINSRLGETAKNISKLFDEINTLPSPEKVIILFDEIDSIALDRTNSKDIREMGRATTAVLKGLDNLNQKILLIATTNLFSYFDKALVRRFDSVIDFNRYSREDLMDISEIILNYYLSKFKFAGKNIRLFRKIISLIKEIPYPGDLKNIIKTSIAFSSPNDEYDYLKRLYSSLVGNKDLKTMQLQGFTVREIEILTGISKSQVSRELKE